MLYMVLLRSPYGHACINSINTYVARKNPVVVGVFIREVVISVRRVACSFFVGYMTEVMVIRKPLAEGKVRFFGDPVAVVIADDRYTARDARDLIEVDYEPLPAAIDVEKAMQPGAPLLYDQFDTNVALHLSLPDTTEEIDKVFEQTKADGGV